MFKSQELAFLQADLAAVEDLLSTRNEDDDPISYFQFSFRKKELEAAIQVMAEQECHYAAIALYFGGRPVAGLRGVDATFAMRAINGFQSIVAKLIDANALHPRGYGSEEMEVTLQVTEVLRGSFGFVLEEASETALDARQDTPLKTAVQEAVTHIHGLAQNDIEGDSQLLDGRTLVSLREFFVLLHESEATMRIVEGDRDFSLAHQDIGVALENTARLQGVQMHD